MNCSEVKNFITYRRHIGLAMMLQAVALILFTIAIKGGSYLDMTDEEALEFVKFPLRAAAYILLISSVATFILTIGLVPAFFLGLGFKIEVVAVPIIMSVLYTLFSICFFGMIIDRGSEIIFISMGLSIAAAILSYINYKKETFEATLEVKREKELAVAAYESPISFLHFPRFIATGPKPEEIVDEIKTKLSSDCDPDEEEMKKSKEGSDVEELCVDPKIKD